MSNPIRYEDLFDFSNAAELKRTTKYIRDLKDAYTEFQVSIVSGTLIDLTKQQTDLAKSARDLANASRELNITNKDAQKSIIDNAKATAQLHAENQKLNDTAEAIKKVNVQVKSEVDLLTKKLREETAEYKRLYTAKVQDKNALELLARSINKTRTQIDQMNSAIKVNVKEFNSAKGSYTALDAETKKLIADLKLMPDVFGKNKKAAAELQSQIYANTKQLKDFDAAMNINIRNVGNYSSAFKDIKNNILSMVGPLALFTATISATKKIITTNAEISDSLSDLKRTAQLTGDEANELLETFKKFDTRTSLSGLLDIAIIAGQLGIAKNDISGFTKSIDMLAVVLAKEIPGGAEAVATALGKINGVFKTQVKEGTTIEEAYNRTGSAILKLGQEGLATGAYLQDFTLRTAGAANQARIALPTMLAYGAVLEENGASAEIGATALNKLIGSLSSRRNDFFAIAKLAQSNLTLKQFTDIINSDVDKALQLFFKGLNAGGKNLTQFSDLLDSIKLKSGPYKNAIVALAGSQELLNTRIESGTKAYEDGTLAAEQSQLKNNNLAGSIDKLGNAATNLTTNPDSNLGKFFKGIVDFATFAINGIDELLDKLDELNRSAILTKINNGAKITDFVDQEYVKSVIADAQRGKQKQFQDEVSGRGRATGQRLASQTSSESELKKVLAGEKFKLQGDAQRLNYTEAFIRDTKNTGPALDAQINKVNKLRVAYAQQSFVVGELSRQYDKLYKKDNIDLSNPDAYKEQGKGKKGKSAEQLEKENDARLDRLYQAKAKYDVSLTELAFTEGEQTTADTIKFEQDKLAILNKSYELRKALYAKDTSEYIGIQSEQTNAEVQSIEKIDKIKQEAADRDKKRLEEIFKAKEGYDKAVAQKGQAEFEAGINKAVSSGTMSKSAGNDALYSDRLERFNAELKAQQEALSKMTEGEADYYNKKREIIDLEKAMIDEKTNYEIAKAELSAEKRKQLEQDVADYVGQVGNALFEIGASFSERKNEEMQHQYEMDISAAGNNAQAKAKIEEEYQRKMLALKRKQAIFDKAQALFNIGIQTALAVSAALAPPPLGLGPVLGIPFAIKAGISGAIQAAVVLAKPLPKFKGGRKGGPGTYAVVNDGSGPELLEKNGKFRIAGGGKETVTYLEQGEKVHTAEASLSMINNNHESEQFLNSILMGTGIMRQNEIDQKMLIANAIMQSKNDPVVMEKAFKSAIASLPFNQTNIDEKGVRKFFVGKNGRVQNQNTRNQLGGEG